MSVEPFKGLVKLVARAFYDDITTRGDKLPKTGRSDNRGIAVVVLDALTRRQWVREEDLAKDLKLHSKQLRRTLRFFEEEKLVTRFNRKETSKGAKFYSAAVAATQQPGREGEEKIKLHTHSYCCLDYAQICDVVRYRLHRMKKMLKDGLENRNTVQEYICPNCSRRYNALDALRLISLEDEYFHCENCNGELVAESDKLATQEMGDGDDNVRRRRREKLKELLQNMEAQLKALTVQLNRVKDLPVPDFGTLSEWEVRVNKGERVTGDPTSNVSNKTSPGTDASPMPFVGEPKIEVLIGTNEGVKNPEIADEPMKKLPPWMITQRMNLTKEQRGEVKQESNIENTSVTGNDNKSNDVKDDDAKIIQNAYYEEYYKAILKRQQEQDAAASSKVEEIGNDSSLDRQIGIKRKHAYNDDDNVDWEEAPPAGYDTNDDYNVSCNLSVNLNAEADADAAGDEEEEDDIDWEEG